MADQNDTGMRTGSRNNRLLIIIIAVLVSMLLGGGAAALYLMKEKPVSPLSQNPALKAPVVQPDENAEIGPMVDIDEFIVNIISGDSAHYVKASLTVELSNENAKTEVENRMPQMRDTVLMLVGNKTYEELQDIQGKKQLKAELKGNINGFLQTGKVKSIYFTNFVVQ